LSKSKDCRKYGSVIYLSTGEEHRVRPVPTPTPTIRRPPALPPSSSGIHSYGTIPPEPVPFFLKISFALFYLGVVMIAVLALWPRK
jgi:hypothetical protein